MASVAAIHPEPSHSGHSVGMKTPNKKKGPSKCRSDSALQSRGASKVATPSTIELRFASYSFAASRTEQLRAMPEFDPATNCPLLPGFIYCALKFVSVTVDTILTLLPNPGCHL
jgi:hypothetical protein